MKKRGRPVKAAADRRGTILRLRLTKKEYQKVCAAAKKEGLSVSEYVRKNFGGGKPWKA